MSYSAEQRRLRYASDPEYAQRCREHSLAAKRKRRGVCEKCGGETMYNGKTTNGPSKICAKCLAQQIHEERHWTRETIVRSFLRFHAETGRAPRALDSQGLYESVCLRVSGRRISELEQVQELGLVLPNLAAVYREFGTWGSALDAAGMPRSRGGSPTHRKRSY